MAGSGKPHGPASGRQSQGVMGKEEEEKKKTAQGGGRERVEEKEQQPGGENQERDGGWEVRINVL